MFQPRYLPFLIACCFLAQSALCTLPILPPGSDPGLLGKWLVARARARVHGHPLPTIEDMMPKSEPKNDMEIEMEPVNMPIMSEVDRNNNEMIEDQNMNDGLRRGHNQEEMVDDTDVPFDDQLSENESIVGSRRRNKPAANYNHENKFHLKPGKHYPEGYPNRSDDAKSKSQVIFPVNPSDSARNIHRVLDSPLPNPGEGPTYTVFVRASENPAHGPTVHIVKHSIQSIMPVESKEDIMLSNFGKTISDKRKTTEGENPEDVLGAAKRDLFFRSGNLYGVPTHKMFGHDPYDAFGHSHHGISINLADFDQPGGYGHGGLGGLGQIGIGGVGHSGYGHSGMGGLGHGGLGHGGLGHGGLGHGGLGHGGLGHGGLGHGGLSHGGFSNVNSFGHSSYGHSGFSNGGLAHGAYDKGTYDQGAFGHGAAQAQNLLDHDPFGHASYSESTHGENVHGNNGFGLGIYGNHNYGNSGAGEFDSYRSYGVHSSEKAHKKEDYPKEPIVSVGLAKQMFLPYMGLLDMKGERGYNHNSGSVEYSKPHCFPPYCPVHTYVEQPIYY